MADKRVKRRINSEDYNSLIIQLEMLNENLKKLKTDHVELTNNHNELNKKVKKLETDLSKIQNQKANVQKTSGSKRIVPLYEGSQVTVDALNLNFCCIDNWRTHVRRILMLILPISELYRRNVQGTVNKNINESDRRIAIDSVKLAEIYASGKSRYPEAFDAQNCNFELNLELGRLNRYFMQIKSNHLNKKNENERKLTKAQSFLLRKEIPIYLENPELFVKLDEIINREIAEQN